MSDSKTYYGVTQAVFDCVRATSEKEHGTVYAPPNGNTGTATSEGTAWTVVLGFEYDPSAGSLAYTIQKKTWIVPKSAIWEGLEDTLNGCQKSVGVGVGVGV